MGDGVAGLGVGVGVRGLRILQLLVELEINAFWFIEGNEEDRDDDDEECALLPLALPFDPLELGVIQ